MMDPQISTERKIAYLLERISIVYRVLLWNFAKEEGLTPLQIQILLFLKNRDPEECTPTSIAEDLNITKATLSDAAGALIRKGLIKKRSSRKDKRTSFLTLSRRGNSVLKRIGGIGDTISRCIKELDDSEKDYAFVFLIKLISSLHSYGLIKIARVCFTCKFFRKNATPSAHICSLTGVEHSDRDIMVECPKYIPAEVSGKGGNLP